MSNVAEDDAVERWIQCFEGVKLKLRIWDDFAPEITILNYDTQFISEGAKPTC